MAAPDVLLSGHHAEIERWRRRNSLERTLARRPDLLHTAPLTGEDREYLSTLGYTGRPHPNPLPLGEGTCEDDAQI